jgi:hypothetical protein
MEPIPVSSMLGVSRRIPDSATGPVTTAAGMESRLHSRLGLLLTVVAAVVLILADFASASAVVALHLILVVSKDAFAEEECPSGILPYSTSGGLYFPPPLGLVAWGHPARRSEGEPW